MTQKITYTSIDVDLEAFHKDFDSALERIRRASGADHPNWIGGEAVAAPGAPLVDVTPIDTSIVLARFACARPADIDRAVAAARVAQTGWARTPWSERLAILRRAAGLIRARKFDLAALMSLEVGKNRLEAMGDADRKSTRLNSSHVSLSRMPSSA